MARATAVLRVVPRNPASPRRRDRRGGSSCATVGRRPRRSGELRGGTGSGARVRPRRAGRRRARVLGRGAGDGTAGPSRASPSWTSPPPDVTAAARAKVLMRRAYVLALPGPPRGGAGRTCASRWPACAAPATPSGRRARSTTGPTSCIAVGEIGRAERDVRRAEQMFASAGQRLEAVHALHNRGEARAPARGPAEGLRALRPGRGRLRRARHALGRPDRRPVRGVPGRRAHWGRRRAGDAVTCRPSPCRHGTGQTSCWSPRPPRWHTATPRAR